MQACVPLPTVLSLTPCTYKNACVRVRTRERDDSVPSLRALMLTVSRLQSLRLIAPGDHKTQCDNTQRSSASGAGILIAIKATDRSKRQGYDYQTSGGGGGTSWQCNMFALVERCQHGRFEEHRKMIPDLSLIQIAKGSWDPVPPDVLSPLREHEHRSTSLELFALWSLLCFQTELELVPVDTGYGKELMCTLNTWPFKLCFLVKFPRPYLSA